VRRWNDFGLSNFECLRSLGIQNTPEIAQNPRGYANNLSFQAFVAKFPKLLRVQNGKVFPMDQRTL
jgi:hypothetical protein